MGSSSHFDELTLVTGARDPDRTLDVHVAGVKVLLDIGRFDSVDSRRAHLVALLGQPAAPRCVIRVTDHRPHSSKKWTFCCQEEAWWDWYVDFAAERGVTVNFLVVPVGLVAGSRHPSCRVNDTVLPIVPTLDDVRAAIRLLASAAGSYLVGQRLDLCGGSSVSWVRPRGSRPLAPRQSTGAVIVTGASSGIGRAAAKAAVQAGKPVLLVARRRHLLEDLAALAPVTTKALAVDLTRPQMARQVIDAALQVGDGSVSGLCHAAGSLALDPLSQVERERLMAINFKSFVALTDELCEHWVERGEGGAISSVSSVTATLGPLARTEAYAASKAALAAHTITTATSMGRRGIRANTILAGYIATPMTSVLADSMHEAWLSSIPLARPGTAAEVGELAFRLVTEDSRTVTGMTIYADGGFHRAIAKGGRDV